MSGDQSVKTTEDAFLGGSVKARQPAKGYRAAMDTVLLAAAVPSLRKGCAVELGCGAGIASLCYAHRVPGVTTIGIDADPDILDLARENAVLNRMNGRVSFKEGRLGGVLDIPAASVDQVFANPPYLAEGTSNKSPDAHRARSMVESGATLSDWIDAMLMIAKPKGGLTLVHRSDRLQELLSLLQGRAGDTTVLPLWPRRGQAAKRIIIHARKGVKGGATLHPGLVLHGDDPAERYTREAEMILRDGNALPSR